MYSIWAAVRSGYRHTTFAPMLCAAYWLQNSCGSFSPTSATVAPRVTPSSAMPIASDCTCRYTSFQVNRCQIPKSFLRCNTRSP